MKSNKITRWKLPQVLILILLSSLSLWTENNNAFIVCWKYLNSTWKYKQIPMLKCIEFLCKSLLKLNTSVDYLNLNCIMESESLALGWKFKTDKFPFSTKIVLGSATHQVCALLLLCWYIEFAYFIQNLEFKLNYYKETMATITRIHIVWIGL